MDIILLEDVEKLGDKFEVVNVKDGYGRNFLIPRGKALIANKTNMLRLQDYRNREERKREAMLDTFREIADQLKGKTLRIGAKSGTSGKIFGSVTALQISNALKEQFGVEVERKRIEMPDEVKEVGTYRAKLNMHRDVDAGIDFEVVSE